MPRLCFHLLFLSEMQWMIKVFLPCSGKKKQRRRLEDVAQMSLRGICCGLLQQFFVLPPILVYW